MKKLLSICFLSIFLMMFGMQAQAQRDCCFQLSNPAADTIHGVANLPGGNLPLSHSMSPLVYGATDVYDMIFSDANCLGIDDGAKVSVELELWCDGENILDGQHDLSRYCNITLQTNYEELHWVGTPMLQENYSFVYEYPGAIPIFSGTYNISNVAFDYFYFRFLINTRSRIVVTWNQIFRDVQLIVHIRERIHGTDNSLYWNSHVAESEYYQIGGHQSHPSRVLASDTLTTQSIIEKNDTIKDCEPVTVGLPPYTMDTTGNYKIAYVDTSCGYRIDSVVNYNYTHYVHPTTPTLSDSTYTYCQRATSDSIVLGPEPNPALADHVADIVAYWSLDGATFAEATSFTPNTDVTFSGADTTLIYYVKRHDNVTDCESEVDTFQVRITPIPAGPSVTDTLVEYCVGETPVALTYTAPAGQQVLWGEDVDNITSTTAPVPTATAAGTKVYYLKLQDTTTVNQCISDDYDSITVKVYDNPTVAITTDNDTLCFGDKASMAATPTTWTTYQWQKDGVDVADSTNTTFTYTNNVTDTTTVQFMVKVTELHVVKSCNAADTIDILAYPTIGAPTPVRGDTAICGPGSVTREVANGTHASTSTWYDKTKTSVLGTGTTYTQNYTETDTLYVSSSNDFGCETPKDNWLRIIVTVDSVPQITLTTDHVGDSVCAEENLIIRSSVVPTGYVLDYVWSGTGLVAPLNRDSVVFNYATAGTYTDTLTVTIHYTTPAHQCSNHATIDITVDTLPVIVKDVNYTVKNNEFCVGVNGKIEFLTPDYERYSIYNGAAGTWRTTKVFDTLAAGNYNLVVEDSRGCKNHANPETIIDAPIMPVLTLTDSANTRCEAPFNGKLIASVTPAATYNYQLLDGAFQADSIFSALKDSTYTVIVKDMTTGCRDTATHNVTNGRVTPVLTLVQNPNTHCIAPFGGSIAVTAMDPADSTYQYKLSTAPYLNYQDDTLFTGLEHGFYTVYARDVNSACVGSDTITVKSTSVLPTATISARPEICYGDTNLVSMVPGGLDVVFDYWTYSGPVPTSDPMVDTILHKQTFSMKGFPAGKHTFTAHFHDTVTHCTNTVTDTLRVIPVNIDLITIPYDAHVCSYDSVKVFCRYFPDDVTDTILTYNWYAREYHYSTPSKFDTVWVSPAYDNRRVSIVVYDNHGCSNSKFVDLNVWQLPALTITGPLDYCENSTTNISASASSFPSYTYEWKKSGTTESTTNTLAINVGTTDFSVNLKVTDGHGCVSDSTIAINVIEIPGAPVFSPDTQYFCDNNVNITYGTPAQLNPTIGTFGWLNNLNPEVERTSGVYGANYVNTENGVSCYSANDTVVVVVTGAPTFTVEMKYNSETTPSTSHSRCYEAGAGDTIHVTVNPAPAAGLTYTYTLNGHTATKDMVVTRTNPGSYIDTIHIVATAVHGSTICTSEETVYYYLTINALPSTAPSDFPHSYNGDSTIFHCEGLTPSYSFTPDANTVLHYDSPTGTTIPTTNGSHTLYVTRTDVTPNCTNTFPYKIVEVPIPTVLVTSKDASSLCGGTTFEDTIVATITNAIDASYSRLFTWNAGTEIVKSDNADTLYHTFTQSDTVVVKVGVRAENGTYSATCYKTPLDSVKIVFQALPDVPTYNATSFGYVGPDTAAYCEGATFTITPADFTTSTGAHVSIVGGNITAPGTYKVIANNDLAPNCPSADTLIFKLHQKRMPVIPVFDTVYYCAGSTPSYTITKQDANDTITYYKGSVLLAGQPDTAGVFTMHVEDKLEGCSKDSTLVIVEVALPTATITNSTNWHNDTICEGSTINETYTFTTVPHVQHTAIETFAWKDIVSTTNSATLIATPTADTSVTFFYHLVDTVANSFSHVACAYNFDSTITHIFFETPKISLLTKDTAFCAGDTVIVTEDFFTLLTTGTELVPTPSLPDTFAAASGTVVAHARYTSFHSCVSADSTITVTRHELPTVSIAPHGTTICYGDTAILKVTGASTYEWSTGATIDSIFAVDSIKYSVTGTDVNGCQNFDTVKVNFYPIFTVALSPDTTVCVGDSLNISATVTGSTGPFELTWYKYTTPFDTVDAVPSTSPVFEKVGPDSSAIVNGFPVPTLYKVSIKDLNGCKSDSSKNIIRIAASNRPAFIFRKIDSTKNIHGMEVSSGDAAGFEMYITNECHDETERVFVAVQIYKNGNPITNAELGTNMDFIISNYNTSYEFDVNHENAPALESVGVKSCYFSDAEYFFPNSEFINYNAYNFDWVYMHFLTTKSGSDPARKITVRTGAFKPEAKGVYTFSFAVIKAGPHTAEVGQLYKGSLKVGGYNGHVGLTTLDTVAFDTFDIYVDSTFVGASTTPIIANQTVIATSPEESAAEKAINMNVYPNPASNNVNVVLSGVEGQTVITVHDMSGKAVTSMKVELNDNNQIINLPVDNFSQGIYFIKAVNGSAVMTKKLIIAR